VLVIHAEHRGVADPEPEAGGTFPRRSEPYRLGEPRAAEGDLHEAQVAQLLGCAVGTVKTTLSQALARLRKEPLLAEVFEREAL
jgi:hypothetical protein